MTTPPQPISNRERAEREAREALPCSCIFGRWKEKEPETFKETKHSDLCPANYHTAVTDLLAKSYDEADRRVAEVDECYIDRITELEFALTQARNAALLEAAKLVEHEMKLLDGERDGVLEDLAANIRSLISSPSPLVQAKEAVIAAAKLFSSATGMLDIDVAHRNLDEAVQALSALEAKS